MEDCSGLLLTLAHSSATLRHMEEAEASLLLTLLKFFAEATQGPCPGNQEALAAADGLLAALDRIFHSRFDSRVAVGCPCDTVTHSLKSWLLPFAVVL